MDYRPIDSFRSPYELTILMRGMFHIKGKGNGAMSMTWTRSLCAAFALAAAGFIVLSPIAGTSAAERTKVMESDCFILTRTTYLPGERQAELHPPAGSGQLLTLITAAEVEVNFQEGDKKWTERGPFEPGKVWYLPPTLLHQFANIGKTPYTYMVVTFK